MYTAQVELKAASVSDPMKEGKVQDIVEDEEVVIASNEHHYVAEVRDVTKTDCVPTALNIKK